MGWWEEGAARILVGDEALDLLLEAFEKVGKVYQAEWGREPTIKEWERLVAGSLLAREDSGGDDGAEVQVSISVSTEEPV